MWEGRQITLRPGQCILGIREIADKLKLDKNTVWRWFSYLETSSRIETQTSPRGTLVTICNWDLYQSTEEDQYENFETQSGTQPQTQPQTQRPPHEEEKKLRKKEIPPTPTTEKISPTLQSDIETALVDLEKTYSFFGMKKDPKFDARRIGALIQRYGIDRVKQALIGARYERKTDKFDPAMYFSVGRMARPDRFELLENLASKSNGNGHANGASHPSPGLQPIPDWQHDQICDHAAGFWDYEKMCRKSGYLPKPENEFKTTRIAKGFRE